MGSVSDTLTPVRSHTVLGVASLDTMFGSRLYENLDPAPPLLHASSSYSSPYSSSSPLFLPPPLLFLSPYSPLPLLPLLPLFLLSSYSPHLLPPPPHLPSSSSSSSPLLFLLLLLLISSSSSSSSPSSSSSSSPLLISPPPPPPCRIRMESVFLAGVFGAILISCFQRRRHRSIANILKGVVVALCCISVVTCLCVCIFTALHLTQLASMTCHTQHTALLHPSTGTGVHLAAMKGSQQYGLTTPIPVKVPTSRQYMEGIEDDEDESEGSGREARDLPHDDDVDEAFEFETVTLATVAAGRENDIVLNVTFCECEKRGPTWVRMLQYPNLSCLEVNNILPVLFVASCVVTAVGALLSGLILYLLWSLKNSFYGATKPHETRPFIFTSNLKNNNKASNGSGSKVSNGDSQFR
ncbi:hypothetical protein Hamer_G024206 [Homarus americanus]|uniref:Uncharacterized protein n=1 Tax=Homarus americanus TaxID=6706 RepID=A0A8J5MPT2_HOMAM|nr:hypothetical protein Hamer_G024206 [Homarus americanus]